MTPEEYNQRELDAGRMTAGHIRQLVEHWQELHALTVDGKFGPKTRAWADTPPREPSRLGLEALEIAIESLGLGEEHANNAGAYVARLHGRTFNEDEPEDSLGAWCASFVWSAIAEAAARLEVVCPVKRTGGAKRLYRRAGEAGSFVEVPAPGDLICWHRGDPTSWTGHVGIVESWTGPSDPDDPGFDSGELTCIEGNRGRFPAVVSRFTYSNPWRNRRFLGLARLP